MSVRLILINIVRWLLLIAAQILLLRNMSYYNLPNPFLYVLFILLLPFGIPNILLYLIAFFTGIILDSFYDTIGVHTTACITLAFIRIIFINISLNKDTIDEPEPSLGNMGFKWFSLYGLVTIFGHHFVLFLLETFSLSKFIYNFGSILLSVVFSLTLVLLVEFLFQSKKRI